MTEISNECTENTGQEQEITYAAACKQQEKAIVYHTRKIHESLKDYKLNQWARIEILNKLRKMEEESLGTIIDPEGVDVGEEDARLEKLYDQIRINADIARMVLSLINSLGYKYRNLNLDQMWQKAKEDYW